MPIKAMENSSRNGGFDDLNTPPGVFNYLELFIPKHWAIWESAPGNHFLINEMQKTGRRVLYATYENCDFFSAQPDFLYDIQITNPPFSQKAKWLERSIDLSRPFALLLPVTSLGSRACQKQFMRCHIQVLFLPKRIDFTGKKAPWFAVAWFTHGLNLPDDIVFVKN